MARIVLKEEQSSMIDRERPMSDRRVLSVFAAFGRGMCIRAGSTLLRPEAPACSGRPIYFLRPPGHGQPLGSVPGMQGFDLVVKAGINTH